MGEKDTIIQRNIGMYPEEWAEVDVLVNTMHISISAAVRFIVGFYRENHDPGNNEQMKRLRELAENYYRTNIVAEEFATEAGLIILSGGK